MKKGELSTKSTEVIVNNNRFFLEETATGNLILFCIVAGNVVPYNLPIVRITPNGRLIKQYIPPDAPFVRTRSGVISEIREEI